MLSRALLTALLPMFVLFLPVQEASAEAKPLFDSKLVSPSTPGQGVAVEVDLVGVKELSLVVRDGGDGFGCDWANWAEPKLSGPQGEKRLTDLKWKLADAGWGQVRVNANAGGQPLRMAGREIENGLGTHAPSLIVYELPAGYTKFTAKAGLDDAGVKQGCGSTVQFLVYGEKPPANVLAASTANRGGSHELADAVSQLDLAEGLEVQLFAGEPTLFSPSNIDIDHLGRVWVCEVVNYRRFANKNNPDRPEGDRILVLEDTDGDGRADKTTVFYQGTDVDSAHGICVLGDRVILSCGDSIFSLYDRDGDLKADAGSKEILFTGISGTQHDHGIHAVVFGPDGKLYFNFGNEGKQLKDKNGQVIIDQSGSEINNSRRPYQEGMVFRCNLDGTQVETLGWNFRNNWEVCVDSYGTMWQSDNDDDGNRGVRINYVMEFGNYGYKDELTGAGWREPRTNLEAEIPLQHWHLNDPGVVPNLLQTGAGSPTGICVYEGSLLPEVYRNQIVHCDAGPNVVRAYVTQPSGAGYTAEMVNLIEGTRDKWFRPSDVCVAPDGSLIVADWYDPGVGGHRQGDVERGRLFRVAPPETKYVSPKVDVGTVEGAIAALSSPNQATRYLAFRALTKFGEAAVPALTAVFEDDASSRQRARALWVLGQIRSVKHLLPQVVTTALQDADPMIRVVGLRLARERYTPHLDESGHDRSHNTAALVSYLGRLLEDPSPVVRRECALALKTISAMPHPQLWVPLALAYDGQDRWMLEALGIGANGYWDDYLTAYLKARPEALATRAGRDLVWRSRGTLTPNLLVTILRNPETPLEELPRYFRAFDFLSGPQKDAAIVELAFGTEGLSTERRDLILAEAVQRLKGFDVAQQPDKLAALNQVLENSQGTLTYLTLVDRFGLTDRYSRLLQAMCSAPDSPFAVEAAKFLLGKGQGALLAEALRNSQIEQAVAATRALGNTLDSRSAGLLVKVVTDEQMPLSVRQEATKGLAKSKAGAQQLIALAKAQKLPAALQPAAAYGLQTSPLKEIQADVARLFPLPPARNNQPLPPLGELVKQAGSVERGRSLYAGEVAKCATCHIVNGQGKEVGPNLSEIGSKLSREAFFEAILYPSAGISHNYETWTAVTTNGTVITGLLVSDTPEAVTLKGSDAIVRTVKKGELEELVKQPVSLMPADLQKVMTVEELVDVVEYLQTLKKK